MSIVGSVTVRVVPSFTGNHRQIAQHFTGAGGVAGQVFSASMGKSIMSSTAKGLVYNRAGADIANRVSGSIRSSIIGTDFGAAFSTAFGKSRAIAAGEGGVAGQSWVNRTASSISQGSAGITSAINRPFTGAMSNVVSVGNATGLSFSNATASSLSHNTNRIQHSITQPFTGVMSSVSAAGNATGLNFSGAAASSLSANTATIHAAGTRPFTGVMSDVVSAGNATGLGFSNSAVSAISGQTSSIAYAVTKPFDGALAGVASVGNVTGLRFSDAAVSSLGQGADRAGQSFTSRLGSAIGAGAGTVVGAAGSLAQSVGNSLMGIGDSISSVSAQLGSLGDSLSGVGASLTKYVTLPAVGAAGAAGGIVAAFGWGRLTGIDTAQAQLKGLGYSVEDVERISGQLVEALEGGMLTMGQATAAAASGMAAGVEEGKELTRYIQLLDAATAGSNTTFEQMNQIFARVQGSGKLMTNELDMMEHRMPGFSGAAAEHFGITQEALREMVSSGEVSSSDFLDIMDNFAGDMATEYAKSWEGMVQNTKAYIGILGQALLGGVFEQSKDSLAEFIEYLSSDDVQQWAAETGEAIGRTFSNIIDSVRGAIDWWRGLDSEHQKLIIGIGAAVAAAGPLLLIFGKLAGALHNIGKFVGPLVTKIGGLSAGAGTAATQGGLLSGVMGGLSKALGVLTGPIGWIAGGLVVLWKSSEDFRESVRNLGATLWDSLVSAFDTIMPQLQSLWGSLQELWDTVTEGEGFFDQLGSIVAVLVDVLGWLLGVIIELAGYIIAGLIMAIDLLVQSLSWLLPILGVALKWAIDGISWAISGLIGWFKGLGDESSTQGGVLAAVWGWIKDTVSAVVDWFVNTAWPLMQSVWDGIASGAVWLWESVLSPTFQFIAAAFGFMVSVIQGIWNNVLLPVFRFIGSVVTWLWENIAQPLFAYIGAAFSALGSVISFVWNGVLKPVFQLVGDIIRWLWNNIAKPMFYYIGQQWRTMVTIIQAVWNNILKPVIDAVAAIFRWLRDTAVAVFRWIMVRWEVMSNNIKSIYNNHIKPIIQAFGDFAKGLYNDYIRPALGWIMDRWEWLKGKISDIWNNGVKPILTAFGDFVRETLVNRIKRGVNMIKDAWESVKEGFAKPINWVIKTVWNDGIKKAFDGVAKAVGSDARMAKIPTIGGYAKGGKVKEDWYIAGEEGPELIHKGNASHRVYTADETAQAAQAALVGQKTKEGKDFTPAEQKQLGPELLPMGNPLAKAWDWTMKNTPVGDALNWVRGGFADMAEGLLQPLLDLAGDNLKGNGLFGDLSHGLVQWGFDQVMEWIRGEDQEDMGDWGSYGSGEVDAYIRALREHESNNNYRAVNPSSGAAGAYQYITSTWGRHGGYARAHLAPKSVQDAKARSDSLAAFNRLGSWEKVAANHLYPAWANSPGKWGQVPAPGNPTVQQYVNSIMSKMSKYATSSGGNPGGFNRPANGPITSRAGRRSYFGAFGNMHYGVDIGLPLRSPVRAAYSGTVKGKSGGGLSRTIVLGHGGFDTAYMHNSSLIPAMGAKVTGGQLIARSGTAGSGPHLHFEVHPGGYYNPSIAGVNNLFRDKGGLIYPGMNQVLNNTGKAEYVFNQAQFENLNRLAEQGGNGGPGMTNNFYGVDMDQSHGIAQDIRFSERRASRSPVKAGVR